MWTVLLRPASDTPPDEPAADGADQAHLQRSDVHFDASGSTDPDDGIDSWDWDFGDGETSTEPVVDHTYAQAGTYTATLTVTDDSDATDVDTQTFAVSTAPPPPPPISFVGRATSNANSTSFTVQVPARCRPATPCCCSPPRAGTTALTGPGAGWTQVGRVSDGEVTTVWRKVAAAGDPGATVRLASRSTFTKVALTLAAYRGTDTTDPVRVDHRRGGAGQHRATTLSPSVANGTTGAWRVSYWSDKNSLHDHLDDAPAERPSRARAVGTGGGRVEQPAHRLGERRSDGRHARPTRVGSPPRPTRSRDNRDHVDGAASSPGS